MILLGLTGLAVGILNVHDHFAIPAIAPLVWNIVIIGGMVGLAPLFEGDDKLYAYAIGVVAGTLVQLLMMLPALRAIGFPVWRIRLPKRGDERVKRVLMLMLPVSVGLGLININLLLNTSIGSLVSNQVPRAIDAAFRIYMLPQGMFSVAVATVLFPQLARLAARRDLEGMQRTIGVGLRAIGLLLIPAGAAMLVLAEPMVRLLYQGGEWTAESTRLTADALFWFAFSLPFSGWVLMLTRGFFSLQRPWVPTTLAVGSLAINAIGSYLLSKPYGISGIVIGTALSNAALVIAEAIWLRHALGWLRDAPDAHRDRADAGRRGGAERRRLRRLVGARRRARALAARADRLRGLRAGRRQRGLRGHRAGPEDPRGAADPRPFRLAPPALVT